MPINIKTQGRDTNYSQLGILTSTDNSQKILPLMGRPSIISKHLWQYYTISENNIKLPISKGKRSCTSEHGCDELYNNDSVYVEGYNNVFNITIYDNNTLQYIPYL